MKGRREREGDGGKRGGVSKSHVRYIISPHKSLLRKLVIRLLTNYAFPFRPLHYILQKKIVSFNGYRRGKRGRF